MKKSRIVVSNLVGLASIMSGDPQRNVVKLKLASGGGSGFPDWLSEIRCGVDFATRRRGAQTPKDVFLERYHKVSETGRVVKLIQYGEYDTKRPKLVDSYWFSQWYEFVGEVDVQDGRP